MCEPQVIVLLSRQYLRTTQLKCELEDKMFEGGKVEVGLNIRSLLKSEEGLHCFRRDRAYLTPQPQLSLADGSFVRALQMYFKFQGLAFINVSHHH